MATKKQQAIFDRMTKILGFLIGIFGALAILGVFFKVLNYPRWELFMHLGFIGEAAAFVVMGSLELGQAFMMDAPADEEGEESAPAGAGTAAPPAQTAARQMIAEKIDDDFEGMMEALGKEFQQFGGEIHEMVGEMKRARLAVQNMRTTLDEAATGSLAEDAEQLGEGMSSLGAEMESAESTVEEMHDDLDEMLRRFRQFNNSHVTPNGVTEPNQPLS